MDNFDRIRRVAARCARRIINLPVQRPSNADLVADNPAPVDSCVPLWTHRLWAGYTDLALAELHRLSVDADVVASVRARAFLQIARWHLAHDEPELAHRNAVLARVAVGNAHPQREQPAVEVDALVALERLDVAAETLERAIARRPDELDLVLRRANMTTDDTQRLSIVNERLAIAGLQAIAAEGPLSIDTLRAEASHTDGPLVSIIVPAHNAQTTLATAIRSLQQQSWHNVQIVVVDDASTDRTTAIADSLAASDNRITVVRSERNAGAYAVRNRGLDAAAGDLITVHDADDWSHPEKIERQMIPLMADPAVMATISEWVRVDERFRLWWSMRPATRLVHRNYSSLLVRREVFDQIGQWDPVRAMADVEFLERIVASLGSHVIETVDKGVPLSFARRSPASLTGDARQLGASTRTAVTGARRLYAEAFRWWHNSSEFAADLPLRPNVASRPFPVADAMTGQQAPVDVELVIVGDLRPGQLASRTVEHLEDVVDPANSVRFLHLPTLDEQPDGIAPEVLELMRRTRAGFLAAGQRIAADRVVLVDPSAISLLPEDRPAFSTVGDIRIIDAQTPDPTFAPTVPGQAWPDVDLRNHRAIDRLLTS